MNRQATTPNPWVSAPETFRVRLARSGLEIDVPPHLTVIQVLAEQGVFAPVSCEQGICGTCLMRVLEGIPDHHDVFLSPEEREANDCFTPCCSRSMTPLLVVDF